VAPKTSVPTPAVAVPTELKHEPPAATVSVGRKSRLADDELPPDSTIPGCAAIAKALRAAAIDEDWGLVRDILVDRCMSLVVTEPMVKQSGIGKVAGKLRNASNPGVAFAAEEVIEAWKFQISLDRPASKTVSILGADGGAAPAAPAAGTEPLAGTRPDSTGSTLSDGSFLARVSRRAGLLDDVDTISPPALDEEVLRGIEADIEDDGDDSADEAIPEGQTDFVAVSTLVRCEELMERIKSLTLSKKWKRLHRVLREQVQPLLVTEDDLRRSGIGRVLAKVERHAETPAVQLLAADIIKDWKGKVGHRDPLEERELEAERLEREKFQQFLNLAPATLGIQSAECADGVDIHGVADAEGGATRKGPVYFEKEFFLERGLLRKPLGFEITLSAGENGGAAAVVGKVAPNGLAAKAAREGCMIEEGDEVISVNGTQVADCTREEAMALFKSATVKLVLRAIVPGSEVVDDDSDEAELYATSRMPLFHKVLPSDFVALA